MNPRRLSREVAMQVLYQLEYDPNLNIAFALDHFKTHLKNEEIDYDYANLLVLGVQKNIQQIDDTLQSASSNWKIDRISHVDRNILRVSIFELLFLKDKVPPKTSINEAIEVAKKFSTESSYSFVNGILDHVSKSI